MTASASRRILVVDDDPGVVDYLVEMLSEEGYITEGVTSPHEALDCLGGDEFDLVIADIEMPGIAGKAAKGRLVVGRQRPHLILAVGHHHHDLAGVERAVGGAVVAPVVGSGPRVVGPETIWRGCACDAQHGETVRQLGSRIPG